jgi:hypothetical protein
MANIFQTAWAQRDCNKYVRGKERKCCASMRLLRC